MRESKKYLLIKFPIFQKSYDNKNQGRVFLSLFKSSINKNLQLFSSCFKSNFN